MSTLIIPDVHGSKLFLDMALKKFPDHDYIFLGDLIDRGEDSRWCLQTALKLAEKGKAKLCIGNHELMAWMHYFNKERNWWSTNKGGLKSCKQSYSSEKELKDNLQEFMELASHYHIVGDTLFAHAGVPFFAGNNILGEFHLWDTPAQGFKPVPVGINKTFHGHTIMSTIQQFSPDNHSTRTYLDLGPNTLCVMEYETEKPYTFSLSF
jgi:hypothetical protein